MDNKKHMKKLRRIIRKRKAHQVDLERCFWRTKEHPIFENYQELVDRESGAVLCSCSFSEDPASDPFLGSLVRRTQ